MYVMLSPSCFGYLRIDMDVNMSNLEVIFIIKTKYYLVYLYIVSIHFSSIFVDVFLVIVIFFLEEQW